MGRIINLSKFRFDKISYLWYYIYDKMVMWVISYDARSFSLKFEILLSSRRTPQSRVCRFVVWPPRESEKPVLYIAIGTSTHHEVPLLLVKAGGKRTLYKTGSIAIPYPLWFLPYQPLRIGDPMDTGYPLRRTHRVIDAYQNPYDSQKRNAPCP